MAPLLAVLLPVASARPADHFDIELRDADVHATIRMLAELGDLDVVVPDTVSGTVSIRLVDVTWDTALRAVLSVEGLTAVPAVGQTFRVEPAR